MEWEIDRSVDQLWHMRSRERDRGETGEMDGSTKFMSNYFANCVLKPGQNEM